MSEQLIAHSSDLGRLRSEGYHITIGSSGHLFVHDVPYLNSAKIVQKGTFITAINTSGDTTAQPDDHTIWFIGDYPCDQHGVEIEGLRNAGRQQIDANLAANFRFSSKPPSGQYADYYEKVTTYVAILGGPAQAIEQTATAKTFPVVAQEDEDTVFQYLDSSSPRAGIVAATRKLALSRVAIVGLGGTGSYVFDLVAKTPAQEIHLFDPDTFYTHNAFRAPGSTSISELRTQPKKVAYLATRYSSMRRGIVEHPYAVTPETAHELDTMEFVFICIDASGGKAAIVERLEYTDIPFIDVGMGLSIANDTISGIVRTTTSLSGRRHALRRRAPLGCSDHADGYDTNIQVADLNALNAVLAVIRWKKLFGFYADYLGELDCTYTIDTNMLLNEESDAS